MESSKYDSYGTEEENHEPIMGISIWQEQIERYEQKRMDFIAWVKETYNPSKVYYPGSGSDRTPKEVLGENCVVHLSLEENKEAGSYFSQLGSGQKIEGNFLESPFKNESFDAVLIHDSPARVTIEALNEFCRVLENDGILILDNANWNQEEINDFFSVASEIFEVQEFPARFHDPDDVLVFVATKINENSGKIIGIITSEKELNQCLENIPPQQQIVIKQTFAVFKKKPTLK